MKTELSLQDVLARLGDEGYLTKPVQDEDFASLSATDETHGTGLPWFIKLFIGIAAWIAAILITSFFFLINLINEDRALYWGLAFCVLAILLNRVAGGNIFWGQLSLAASLTGQALAIVGLFQLLDELLLVTIGVAILESILIAFHRDAVLRFIATLVVVSFFLVLIFEEYRLDALHLLIFMLAAGSLFIHLLEHRLKQIGLSNVLVPVGSAMTFSFLGILSVPLMDRFELDWWITAVLLFLLLLLLLAAIATDLGYALYQPVVLVLAFACALLLIPALRMPGILAALIVLTVAFWRSNRGLIGLASIFLVFYIWAYYYSLEWTLLTKSLVLLGSGIILLSLRSLLIRFIPRAGGDV